MSTGHSLDGSILPSSDRNIHQPTFRSGVNQLIRSKINLLDFVQKEVANMIESVLEQRGIIQTEIFEIETGQITEQEYAHRKAARAYEYEGFAQILGYENSGSLEKEVIKRVGQEFNNRIVQEGTIIMDITAIRESVEHILTSMAQEAQ